MARSMEWSGSIYDFETILSPFGVSVWAGQAATAADVIELYNCGATGDLTREENRLTTLGAYRRGFIPVVFVHGTASSSGR